MIPAWVNTKDGQFLNALKYYVKGGFMSPGIPPGQTTPDVIIPAAPAATIPSAAPSVVIEAGADEIAELFSCMGFHSPAVAADVQNRMSVLITDSAYRRRLMNRDILVNHVFGTNLTPLFVNESTVLESQQTMLFDFLNNSTVGPTDFQFGLEKRKFQATALSRQQVTDYLNQMRRRKLFLTPYWLTSDAPVNIPAAGTRDVFFTTTKDVYVVLFSNISSFISTGVAGDVIEGFTVEMFDAKTERPLFNQPIARSCCSGTAGFPFKLPTGWMVEPNTKIHLRFTNLITDAAIEIFWTFLGVADYASRNPFQYPEADISVAQPNQFRVGAP